MANVFDPTPDELAEWNAWLAGRPEKIRQVAARFEPWKLYRLKSTGHRVFTHSFQEPEDERLPVTMTVEVSGQFNLITFERRVFGISPEDLTECELPAETEPVGVMLEAEDKIEALIDQVRDEVLRG